MCVHIRWMIILDGITSTYLYPLACSAQALQAALQLASHRAAYASQRIGGHLETLKRARRWFRSTGCPSFRQDDVIEFLNPKNVSNPFLPICFPGHAVRSTCTERWNTKTGPFSFFRSVYGSACDAVPKWPLGLRYRCLNWVSTCAVLPGGGLDVISRYICIYIYIFFYSIGSPQVGIWPLHCLTACIYLLK